MCVFFFSPCDFPFPALPLPRTLLDTNFFFGGGEWRRVMTLGMIIDFDIIKYNFFNYLYSNSIRVGLEERSEPVVCEGT